MSWDSTPWLVGGGAEHSAEVARVLAYTSTGAAEGVVEPLGLKVTPLAVPGAGVRVGPGACLIRNRYAAGGEQSYVGRHPSTSTITVTPTGSGAQRTDLLVARVLDPQYEGAPAPDPNAFDYSRFQVIQGVPFQADASYATTLGYPAIALAKWTLPPSTGTITAGMITDLRTLAIPKSDRILNVGAPAANVALTSTTGAVWPSRAPMIYIPAWATHMAAVATISAIGYQNGSVTGALGLRAGPGATPGVVQWRSGDMTYDLDVAVGDGARTTLVVAGSGPIDPSLRGKNVEFAVEGKRSAFTGSGALITRAGTQQLFDVSFSQGLL